MSHPLAVLMEKTGAPRPQAIVRLDQLPRNSNGKVDRPKLPEAPTLSCSGPAHSPPESYAPRLEGRCSRWRRGAKDHGSHDRGGLRRGRLGRSPLGSFGQTCMAGIYGFGPECDRITTFRRPTREHGAPGFRFPRARRQPRGFRVSHLTAQIAC